ncbi:sugar ABC transporter permease [Vallitalea longa]|uniref:Sugar ABC transporter permease n=1 Tax=Vallitalea longa TaxID=2936439 RepID=A0A9W6DDI6_9FIRM|nr:carbohydrate ABC transporter permease [Vallitalea longa]GKX28230.1 sugar ABC transporter permease [Vallitalea longa]
MNKTKKILSKIFTYVVIVFTIIVSTFPIIWVIISSFKTNGEILSSPFSLPSSINFDAYMYLFEKYDFLTYAINSILITSVATLGSLIIYALGAYVIAKYDFPGKNLFYVLFTLTLLVPAHSRTQPIFSLIMKLNLYNTREALMLVYLSGGMAMSMFILKSTFMAIPKSFDEAASIEGAGFFKVFYKINLPLAKNGLLTAGVLMFLANWNEYYYASLLTTSTQNRTLPVVMLLFNEAFSYDYTLTFAALVIVALPGIIIYSIAQEQVQESLASSGIKG